MKIIISKIYNSFLIKHYNLNIDRFSTQIINKFFVSNGENDLFNILNDIILISVNEKDRFITNN